MRSPIANGRAVKVAADALAPVLLAGRHVVARDDAAIVPQEQQVAGDDGRRHLRHVLLQAIDFLRRRCFVAGANGDQQLAVAALAAGDEHHSAGDDRRADAALRAGRP